MSARPKLTPHQREVYDRMMRIGNREGWVQFKWLGSRGACNKLVAKGYAEHRFTYGKGGGEHSWYRALA